MDSTWGGQEAPLREADAHRGAEIGRLLLGGLRGPHHFSAQREGRLTHAEAQRDSATDWNRRIELDEGAARAEVADHAGPVEGPRLRRAGLFVANSPRFLRNRDSASDGVSQKVSYVTTNGLGDFPWIRSCSRESSSL